MSVFVIQVSGKENEHEETRAKAKKYWQEPIEQFIYINYDWKRSRILSEAWQEVKEGDKILVYCTAGTPWPSSLSHIFTVDKVELKEDKAIMYIKDKTEIKPPMPLDIIRKKIENNEFSQLMKGCGTQGYIFWKVEEGDLKVVEEWMKSREGIAEAVRISREEDIHRYLSANLNTIEDCLRIVDTEEVLPDEAGIPDLICEDKNGNYVVIEIKAGTASYDALGQLISYKTAVKYKTGKPVRAILVASDFDPKIKFATKVKDSDGNQLVEFKKYSVRFYLENA